MGDRYQYQEAKDDVSLLRSPKVAPVAPISEAAVHGDHTVSTIPANSLSHSEEERGRPRGVASGGPSALYPPSASPPAPQGRLFSHVTQTRSISTAVADSLTLRQRIWELMDVPSSSRWAKAVAATVLFAIAVSTLSFVIETLPQFHRKNPEFWGTIEMICIILFTVEFVLRFLTTPDLKGFCKSFLNIVDFVAILPFYIELVVNNGGESSGSGSGAVFRVIRLVRVFRVFKISRYVSWVKIFASALAQSAWPLGMLVFVMAIGMVVFSALIFYTERGDWQPALEVYIRDDGSESPFQSIPASFWWCIVTMTTVGYGDHVPITAGGRVIAAITSLLGILVLAIPITVISTNFNSEYSKLKKQKELLRARMMLLKNLDSSKRSGLEAMNDEIDEIVRRNSVDFRHELESLFDQSKDELTEELKEVTRMAYRQRQQVMQSASVQRRIQPGRAYSGSIQGAGSQSSMVSAVELPGSPAPSTVGISAPLPDPTVAALRDMREFRSSPLNPARHSERSSGRSSPSSETPQRPLRGDKS